jgi:hypothetical protein
MKLTKKAVQELNNILRNATRCENFIYNENTLVCTKTSLKNGHSFVNTQGDAINSINKFCGSNLVGINDAVNSLRKFIAINS